MIPSMQIHEQVRTWIAEILATRDEVVGIAIRQRAKFEGWLKFELAALAESRGAVASVESSYGNRMRADVLIALDERHYLVELKTPNTNWRIGGVQDKVRPITKNIKSIIDDAAKLSGNGNSGVIAFVLFPVPSGDCRWHTYIRRISKGIGRPLTEEGNCSRVQVHLQPDQQCEAVVCCFEVT